MQHIFNDCLKSSCFLLVFFGVFLHVSVSLLNFVPETQQQEGNITHTTTTLSQGRWGLASTSSGELVFFGGGNNETGPTEESDRVDIYNVTSGSWTTSTLSIPRYELAATSSRNLVFFGGGWDGTTSFDRVDIYNTLNGSWSTATLYQPRYRLAATSVGNLVLFGGGFDSTNGPSLFFNVVDVFDVTNNTWTTATLSQARWGLAATSVNNRYALFGAGYNGSGSPSNVVDIFDSLSGMWNTTTLSQARSSLASTSLGNLAFFGGGQTNGSQPSKVVDIFNSTSQTWSTSTLSQARYQLAASSIGEIVAFGGGWNGSTPSSVVDMLNVTSNIWFTVNLSQPRRSFASTSSTNKIIFGGGFHSVGGLNFVDIFEIPLPPPPPPISTPSTTSISNSTTSPISSPTSTTVSTTPISTSTTSPQSTETVSSSISTLNPQTPFPSFIPLFVESPFSTQSNQTNLQTNSEVVVGVVVGIIALLIGVGLILLIVFIKRRKKRKNKKKRNNEQQLNENNSTIQQKKRETVVIESDQNTITSFDETNTNTTIQTQLFTTLSNSLQKSQISFNELIVENKIGKGSYGKVYLGKWNAAPVALKLCKKKDKIEDFRREIKLMIELPPHPNVVHLFGVSLDGPQPVIVMEYCVGGSLDKLLFDSNVKLSEEHKIRLIRGIAAGMLHLHKHNIIHRDLAARNILLTSGGEPKISDFGMSRILEKVDEGKTQSGVGPVCWMAPESLATRNYSKKSDVWTFGIVVYEIVAQCEPHKDKDVIEVAVKIRDEGLTPEIPSNCPQKLVELMQMCWKKQPQQRPDFETICVMLEE